ncbi:hypothetical protein I3843_14G010900 [Carya illinoinensis]|uniref:VQ domain-containing protein n=1 Tax=Carya illinoinensis TaxID=32201 RepID=A0A8T1NES2_CARIL|nr:hypothetical protein I3760_14G011000 [Carya illinoinensis]KAG6628362.1 hypothetical protein CIPAW_14G008700 [Carya illinoinensis]KAG6677139.1 hypothetical protein I3842_14G010900 [Carya illinoinensis]KAG7945892.1 hypothetical protein I3843_14G010900 [Carya illinoinensis]
MDVLGVNNVMNSKKQAKRSKKPLKVVYISTPMKVQTSASNFRDLVQELTGRDSDTARFMELSGDHAGDHDQEPRNNYLPDQQQQLIRTTPDDDEAAYKFPLSMSYTELLQPYSEASFNSFSHEHLQLGVLRSFNPV